MNIKTIVLIFGLTLCFVASTFAENKWDDLEFHGYLSQAFVSSNNAYATPDTTNNGSFEFREIGLNMFWDVTDDLSLVGGLLSRKYGDVDDGGIKLDYLLVDYNFYSSNILDIGIRAGRVKNKLGLYNVARDMPTSHPGIFLPSSIYFESFRDLLLSTDGTNLYTNINSKLGLLGINIYSGTRKNSNNSLESYVFQQLVPGKFKKLKSDGLHIDFLPNALPNLNLSFSHLQAKTKLADYPLMSADEIMQAGYDLYLNPALYKNYTNSMHLKAQLNSFALKYFKDQWTLSAEYMRINTTLSEMEILFQQTAEQNITTIGYYGQLEYAFTPDLQTFIRYDHLVLNDKDPKGIQAKELGSVSQKHSLYSQGTTVGLMYALRHNLSLNLEYSSYQGTAWLPLFDDLNFENQKKNWHIAAIQLVYDF